MNEEQEEEIKLELNLSEIIEQLHGIRRSENWIRRCAFLLQSCEKMLSALPNSAFKVEIMKKKKRNSPSYYRNWK